MKEACEVAILVKEKETASGHAEITNRALLPPFHASTASLRLVGAGAAAFSFSCSSGAFVFLYLAESGIPSPRPRCAALVDLRRPAAAVGTVVVAAREGVCSYAVGGSVKSCSSSSVEMAGSTTVLERRAIEMVELRRDSDDDELRRTCFSAGKGVVECRRVDADGRRRALAVEGTVDEGT